MKLTYIYHSCYALETEMFAVIFDYYKDSGDSPVRGYLHDKLLCRNIPVYVLASHYHPDHFNRDILKWKEEKDNINYILSRDILTERKAPSNAGIFLDKGDCWEDDNIHIRAFGSTDVGVSFLLTIEGKSIFHAGDLNNWHWKEESTPEEIEEAEKAYLAELEELAMASEHIDLAMFPIDPRLGADYMRGAEQFVSRIDTGILAPMHFGEAYNKVAAFAQFAQNHNCRLLPLSRKGENFINI